MRAPNRKRQLALFNRKLAWVFVALTMIGIPLGSAVETEITFGLPAPVIHFAVMGFYFAFAGFMAVHTVIAVYVFGLPRPRRSWHTLFIYLGYANLVLGVLSLVWRWPFFFLFVQSMIAHVAIGARAALRRNRPRLQQP